MTDPETLAILSDTDAMRQLAEAESEIVRGLGESEEQFTQAMQRRQRQSRAVAASQKANADQAFVDSVSEWPED